MILRPAEKQLRANLYTAFECLRRLGLRRRRFSASAHEYEAWFYSSTCAVRLTLERQWGYQYLFVLFLSRGSLHEEWRAVGYLDSWLHQHGWGRERIEEVLDAGVPVQNLHSTAQLQYLRRVAELVCKVAADVFERSEPIVC